MLYVRFPLRLRNVEYLLFARGIDICHETPRLWWNRFGPLLAADIQRRRIREQQGARHWRWHRGYLARATDPPPGNTVIWRGLSRLTNIKLGVMIGMQFMGN
jgi:transposase-like protein